MAAFPGIAPGLFTTEGGQIMSLYAKIPDNPQKIIQGITALEWQLRQEIPEKDRKIFEETLKEYRSALENQRGGYTKITI